MNTTYNHVRPARFFVAYVFVMSSTTQQLKTLGQIASELDRQEYSIAYIITSRRIQETQRAGIVRLFDDAAVEQIKAALAEMAKR